MSYRPSASSVRIQVRSNVARLQSRIRQAVQDNQRNLQHRISSMTNNGSRALTRSEIEQLGRDSARYLRSRLK